MPKYRVVQALCTLAQKGLIFMTNPIPGRQALPNNALSLGVHGAENSGSSSYGSITAFTLLMLNVPYEQAVDAFRVRTATTSNNSSATATSGPLEYGRPRVPVQVSERLRKAVLEPLIPVVYQANGSSLSNSLSLSAHQGITDTMQRVTTTHTNLTDV